MNQGNGTHEVADPVQDFIDWLKKRTFFKVNKKKLLKRTAIFVLLFSLFNIWLYSIHYKSYLSKAPSELTEARKEFVNALMFHTYYTFLVKTVRIDFQNPMLYPLKVSRDYFYHRGMSKLPVKEAEKAYWFSLFEANLYMYSVRASYGSLARHYDKEFANEFIESVYENIKIISLYELSDTETEGISTEMLEIYIQLLTIYVSDSHLNPKGYIYNIENLNNVSSNKKLHERYLKIYTWQKSFLSKFRENNSPQYDMLLNPSRGWYSAYRNYNESLFMLSSWILFYKVNNNVFDCDTDASYFKSVEKTKQALLKLLESYPKGFKQRYVLQRAINYLSIPNSEENSSIFEMKNPLGLTVNCVM